MCRITCSCMSSSSCRRPSYFTNSGSGPQSFAQSCIGAKRPVGSCQGALSSPVDQCTWMPTGAFQKASLASTGLSSSTASRSSESRPMVLPCVSSQPGLGSLSGSSSTHLPPEGPMNWRPVVSTRQPGSRLPEMIFWDSGLAFLMILPSASTTLQVLGSGLMRPQFSRRSERQISSRLTASFSGSIRQAFFSLSACEVTSCSLTQSNISMVPSGCSSTHL
mmetsp:Transcript_58455/g.187744  ORF Transcript_58455/g.187744 Transcript_58455/m.187744 type:complete len:220 (+) Transcript_58455:109-768(+)